MMAANFRVIGSNSFSDFLVVMGDSVKQVLVLAPLALLETPSVLEGSKEGTTSRFGGTDFIVEQWHPFEANKYHGHWATYGFVTERVVGNYKALKREQVVNG